ncbi:glycosyltransferase family 2 protein [Aureibacter tunicatorum]|uniref:Glycosyltransferase involved in cell wall biosynthesis n=1 Tax=Aureibacter tunicatorum TaxID=866807 RepID=A0AAE4BPV7_9BACT|nr:glycosyltransferase family 2 protein [Aureibacter tunicatorum]MDR6238404.1 glycosyltransferase involved in cell wall biosynthesis [Aureibacter tunicatorum]BDD03436.1 glycosyl transferase [Aureibacter tunicatorum]
MKNLNIPKVSVVTIVYNNVNLIERTLRSVTGQTYSNIEYVVIDGASSDGTLEIIKKYSDRIATIVSEPDKGIYDAMNKGLNKATGDYIIFMNSGDSFSALDVVEKVFDSEEGADVYFGETNLVNESGNILGTRSELSSRQLPEKLTANSMLKGMVVCHQSFFVRRSLAPQYDTKYRCSADVLWVVRCLKKANKIVNVHMNVSNYLVGGFSISNQKKSWKERFDIYMSEFGVVRTLTAHVFITLRYLGHRLSKNNKY